MKKVTPFDFTDLESYLQKLFEEKKRNNPRYSIRSWSKRLGYKGPAYLAQVLKLERKANFNLLEKIYEHEKLNFREWRQVKLLYLSSQHQDFDSKLFNDLLELNRPHQPHDISLDAFDVLSEWYYFTLVELTKIKGFEVTVDSIYGILQNELSKEAIVDALEFLVKANYLGKESGGYRKNIEGIGQIFTSVPSQTIQLFHQSMLEIAKLAIEKQTMKERHYMSSTFAIKEEFVDIAMNIIEETHLKLQDLSSDNADFVYQFNTQLFKMTKKRRP